MAYNQMVSASRILTTGATEGQVLTVDSGGTSASFQTPFTVTAHSTGQVSLAHNATATISHSGQSSFMTSMADISQDWGSAVRVFNATSSTTAELGTVTYSGSATVTGGWLELPAGSDSDYAYQSGSLALGSGSWCFEFTMQADVVNAQQHVCGLMSSSDELNYEISFMLMSSGSLRLGVHEWGSADVSLGTLTAGTVYNVAVSYDGSTLRGFLNGSLVYSAAKSLSLSDPDRINYGRPATAGGERFNGRLKWIRITKGAAVRTAAYTPSSSDWAPDDTSETALTPAVDYSVVTTGTGTTFTNLRAGTHTSIGRVWTI